MTLEEENRLLKKALLIASSKYGYATYEEEEPVDEEEAQAISIYNQYTRPKAIARKMLDIAKTNRYELQFDLTIKNWEREING